MREILFRGKRNEIGDWVEGSLIVYPDGDCYIARPSDDPNALDKFCIDPATVGQHTGLKDKNGKKIFEGDVYKYFDDEIQVVEWSEEFSRIMLHSYGEHEVKRGRKKVKVKHEGWCDLEDYPLEEMEYLGNIHDNPELIGGVEDG